MEDGATLRVVGLLLVTAALVGAPAVAGAIVPQTSIGGVALEMPQGRLHVLLGGPLAVRRRSGELGVFTTYRYRRLDVIVHDGIVINVLTTRTGERTPNGLGVDSTETQLRRGLPRARCEPLTAGARHCYLGRYVDGERVTDFVIHHGRVTEVAVGIVFE